MQIQSIKTAGGQIFQLNEWTNSPLYSTVEFGASQNQRSSELRFFSYGEGGSVPGSPNQRSATHQDTNFAGRGAAMQENRELYLYGFRFSFTTVHAPGAAGRAAWAAAASQSAGVDTGHPALPGVSAKNMQRIYQDTLFKFTIANSKLFQQHPIGLFPGAMGVHREPSQDTGLDGTQLQEAFSGDVQEESRRKLGTPHHIMPGERFVTALLFPHGEVRGLALGDPAVDPINDNHRIRVKLYLEGYRKRPVA